VRVDRATWQPQPIFGLVGEAGGIARGDLEAALNLGVGMVAVVASADADRTVTALTARGVDSWVCGEVADGSHREMSVELVGDYRS
jgi:phosphoribosylformylglycinamidine cyclo-ligase